MIPRLLLVDDEPRNLDALEAVLRPRLECEIVRAAGGREALTRLAERLPDLMLLDLSMPDLDGVDVLKRVRLEPKTADLPVVVVTAHNDRASRLRVLEAGADDFLEKPLDPPVLWARVKNLLQMKQSRDEIRTSRDELQR